MLKHTERPGVRSQLIHLVHPLNVDPTILINRLLREPNVSIRHALLLSLGEYPREELSPQQQDLVKGLISDWYRTDGDAGIHGVCEWLLQHWGQQSPPIDPSHHEEVDRTLGDRRWYVTPSGHTMTIIEAGEFPMGSPTSEPYRVANVEQPHVRRIDRRFAIATKEVTVAQFAEFLAATGQTAEPDTEKNFHHDLPHNRVSWYQAAQYCNWLTKQDGFPESDACYLPNQDGQYAAGMHPRSGYLQCRGYRLPSESEWEYACRAGAVTSRYYGDADELLKYYAWHDQNSEQQLHPVGLLKPNEYGLFDMFGNVYEWCHSYLTVQQYATPDTSPSQVFHDEEDLRVVRDSSSRAQRGGSFLGDSIDLRAAYRGWDYAVNTKTYFGFRIVRTMPAATSRL
jgi:hypothetical protein